MANAFFEIESDDGEGLRSVFRRQGARIFLTSKHYAWDYFEVENASGKKSVRFRLPFDENGNDTLGLLSRISVDYQWGKEPDRNFPSRIKAKAGPPLDSFEALHGTALYEELWLVNRPVMRVGEAVDFALADIESGQWMAAAFWMGAPLVVAPCGRRKAGDHWKKLGSNAKEMIQEAAGNPLMGRENELGYLVQIVIDDTIELIAPVKLDPKRHFKVGRAGDYRSGAPEGLPVLAGREALSNMIVGVKARGGFTFGR